MIERVCGWINAPASENWCYVRFTLVMWSIQVATWGFYYAVIIAGWRPW